MPVHHMRVHCSWTRSELKDTKTAMSAGPATPDAGASEWLISMHDVPPVLSSTAIWSPIPNHKEIGHEEAL